MLIDPERLVDEWESDRYRELFSWAPLGYARLSFGGRICELNYTGADLLEVTTASIVGQPFTAYVARPDRRGFLDHLARARQSRETIEDAIELRSAGGHHFPVRICTRRSPKLEQQVCWTMFADLDIHRLDDDRRRTGDGPRQVHAESRMERVDVDMTDRFVAALSHQLRTPLAPMLMATSMLSSLDGLPAPATTIIETIRRNVEREARLIDCLLDQIAIADRVAAAHRSSPAPESGATSQVGAEERRSRAAPLRILIVEDHTDSGAMLDLLLTSRGHTVGVANSVAAALARRSEHWDVVISDLGLPDGSGLEIGRVMRALPVRPRLIALSGYGRPSDVVASQEAGFDHHLVKPLEPDRLFEILEAHR